MTWSNSGSGTISPLFSSGTLSGSAYDTLPAGGSVAPIELLDISGYASYDFNAYFQCLNQNTLGAALTMQVQLTWFDDLVSGIPVFEEDWWPAAGSAVAPAFNTLAGCGPMHGRYMTVTLINYGTTSMTVQYLNIFGSPRVVPYSDWRQNSALLTMNPNGWTWSAGDFGISFDNLLASYNQVPIPGGAQTFLPIGMYAGPVWISYEDTSSVAFDNDSVLVSLEGLTSGALIAGTACPNILYNFANSATPANTLVQMELVLPRSACALLIKGGSTVADINFTVTAQQAA